MILSIFLQSIVHSFQLGRTPPAELSSAFSNDASHWLSSLDRTKAMHVATLKGKVKTCFGID